MNGFTLKRIIMLLTFSRFEINDMMVTSKRIYSLLRQQMMVKDGGNLG
jgi:hypothetical protein